LGFVEGILAGENHPFFNDLEADKEMDGKIKESEVPVDLMKGGC